MATLGEDWLAIAAVIFSVFWLVFALICGLAILFETALGRLIHALLVELYDSHMQVGFASRRPQVLMTLYKLRSLRREAMTESALRKAQELTEEVEPHGFELGIVAESLGRWVGREFLLAKTTRQRKRLLDALARLIRGHQGQKLPNGRSQTGIGEDA